MVTLLIEASNAVNRCLHQLGRAQIHPSRKALVKATLQQLVDEGHEDLAELLDRVQAAPAEEFGG